MTRRVPVCVTTGVLACLVATSQAPARQTRGDLDALRERGAIRFATVSPETGRVTALMGDLPVRLPLSTDPDSLARSVELILADLGSAVADLPSGSSLTLDRTVQSPIGSHIRVRQMVGSREVFGAGATVNATQDGRVYSVTSSLASDVDRSLALEQPSLDAGAARTAAFCALAVSGSNLRHDDEVEPVLGVFPAGTGRLAWRVVVPLAEPYEQWEVFVDAGTGEPLGEPSSMVVRANARVFVPNAVVATGNVSLPDASNGSVSESAYTLVELRGLNTSGFVTGPFCSTDRTDNRVSAPNGDFTSLRRSNRGFNEVQAYWAIDAAQRYIQSLGINSAANYQIHVDAYAFADDNSNYTFGGDGTGVLNFGEGGVDDAQDSEIVWHEYGHAILDNQARITNRGEAGAIHEGFGDYVAATLSTTVAGDSRFHPFVGEWDAVSYNPGNPAFLRRVDTSKQYPRDLRNQVHTDGEIWSSCLWEIHQALGRDAANRIIFNANFLFSTNVNMPEAAAAVFEADLQLNGGANGSAIRTAFARHGIQVSSPIPTISGIKLKTTKITVDGSQFQTGTAVIEIDGVALDRMKYPKDFQQSGGVTSRIASKDPVVATLQRGVTYQITVLNPTLGVRSAPFALTP